MRLTFAKRTNIRIAGCLQLVPLTRHDLPPIRPDDWARVVRPVRLSPASAASGGNAQPACLRGDAYLLAHNATAAGEFRKQLASGSTAHSSHRS